MQVQNYKCDICGIIAQSENYIMPKGWICVNIEGDKEKEYWADNKDICPACGLKVMDCLYTMHGQEK